MDVSAVKTFEDRRADLDEYMAASRRQTAALEALVDAIPEGLTREELEWVTARFAQLARESGPRRGLCRFER